jgi:ParB-like chromosome segregation protein Spo0J
MAKAAKNKRPGADVGQTAAVPEDLKIQYRPLADMVPYARNARTHSDEQIAQIAASIREFGFTNPVLLDGNNGIIAGHGRLLAAREVGLDRS